MRLTLGNFEKEGMPRKPSAPQASAQASPFAVDGGQFGGAVGTKQARPADDRFLTSSSTIGSGIAWAPGGGSRSKSGLPEAAPEVRPNPNPNPYPNPNPNPYPNPNPNQANPNQANPNPNPNPNPNQGRRPQSAVVSRRPQAAGVTSHIGHTRPASTALVPFAGERSMWQPHRAFSAATPSV